MVNYSLSCSTLPKESLFCQDSQRQFPPAAKAFLLQNIHVWAGAHERAGQQQPPIRCEHRSSSINPACAPLQPQSELSDLSPLPTLGFTFPPSPLELYQADFTRITWKRYPRESKGLDERFFCLRFLHIIFFSFLRRIWYTWKQWDSSTTWRPLRSVQRLNIPPITGSLK